MAEIFISYKREEQHIAQKFAELLEVHGWSVWWDPKIHAGERFDEVILEALNGCQCVIVIWSKRSINSTYIRDEASYARDQNKLVPVAVEDVQLPFRFNNIHTENFYDWEKGEKADCYARLIKSISKLVPAPQKVISASESDVQASLLDCYYLVEINLEDAAKGTTEIIKGSFRGMCEHCGGGGNRYSVNKDLIPCNKCNGKGSVLVPKALNVKIPAGVDTGDRIRLKGEGHSAQHQIGDLYLNVQVRSHPTFTRSENNLFTKIYLSYALAENGGELTVPTLFGLAKVKIPPNFHSGKKLRLRGKGLPSVRGESVGDLICYVQIGPG
ncbi:DnaJ C-terminal domain-containing protein [Oceanobacter kriegii]|uniref:DnaJ C-terminal domain-containing protein n=1 Tax=Oceanobacter kriegii TaxID=64972 RepID=UPI000413A761|nr:DnaJ C-terminal domain-containing protein [Oceanobacter kriegii]